MRSARRLAVLVAWPLVAASLAVPAARADEGTYLLRGQATYIAQRKPAFDAAYSGPNSLRAERERSYSATATLFAGTRLWEGAEAHLNPEVTLGLPFSELRGLGGLTNGELARTSGRDPTLYRARAFVRQTIDLGGGSERLDAEDMRLARSVGRERVVITFGNVSALDIFDDAAYAKDPRTQFMNWSLFAPGAWDYPADARGYTWGLAVEYVTPAWTARAGRFLMPRESNGLPLDRAFTRRFGDVIEFERRHAWGDEPGAVRALAFRNRARMASFEESVAIGRAGGTTPTLDASRAPRDKIGAAVSAEQSLGGGTGVFTRLSWGDGKSETFAFTEIDRSYTAGVVRTGASWGRTLDSAGIGVARNEISPERRAFLGAGGAGFFIGDGRLAYGAERVVEAYYSAAIHRRAWITFDYQHITNPAYNRDRGPVHVFGVRLRGVL